MIASNYRRHPDALALQLPLPFGHVLRWALPRPGARVLRAIRAARGAAFKAAGRLMYPAQPVVPQWVEDAKRKARELAKIIKVACMPLSEESAPPVHRLERPIQHLRRPLQLAEGAQLH